MDDSHSLADFQNLLHEIFCNRRFRNADEIRAAVLKDQRSKKYRDWITEADPRALEVMHALIQKWNLMEGT
jgi:hypothetical protein